MSALFHDIGMTLTDIEDKEKQRSCHHLYAREPIIQYCEKYLGMYSEHRRIRDCVVFVCEAHGRLRHISPVGKTGSVWERVRPMVWSLWRKRQMGRQPDGSGIRSLGRIGGFRMVP